MWELHPLVSNLHQREDLSRSKKPSLEHEAAETEQQELLDFPFLIDFLYRVSLHSPCCLRAFCVDQMHRDLPVSDSWVQGSKVGGTPPSWMFLKHRNLVLTVQGGSVSRKVLCLPAVFKPWSHNESSWASYIRALIPFKTYSLNVINAFGVIILTSVLGSNTNTQLLVQTRQT